MVPSLDTAITLLILVAAGYVGLGLYALLAYFIYKAVTEHRKRSKARHHQQPEQPPHPMAYWLGMDLMLDGELDATDEFISGDLTAYIDEFTEMD